MPVVRAAVKKAEVATPAKAMRAVVKPKTPADVFAGVFEKLGKSLAGKKAEAEKNYYATQTAYYQAASTMRGYSQLTEERIKTWQNEFKNVSALPSVEKVELSGFEMTVTLKSLEMLAKSRSGKDETRVLGSLGIQINLLTSIVRINNLTHPNKRYCAPHCPKGTQPCYGNMATAVPELMARGDLSTFIALLVELFTHPNVNDAWGASFYDFPVKG